MRIISYEKDDTRGLGIMTSDTTFAPVQGSLRDVLETPGGLVGLHALVQANTAWTLDQVVLKPLVERPNAIWAMALNFKHHLEETGLVTSETFPHVFLRTASSLVGHGEALLAPPPNIARAFDYEGELGVVIGRRGRYIATTDTLDYIAGYTVFNEGSVREYQSHNRNFGLGKSFGSSGSYGPWLMTRDEFGEVADKTVTTRINGVDRQHSRLDDMLFNVSQVISYLSQGYELEPGDLIAMGTPGSLPRDDNTGLPEDRWDHFGRRTAPGVVHMRPGDIVEVEISGLGILRNPVAGTEVGTRTGWHY